jgi:hypothetical protein
MENLEVSIFNEPSVLVSRQTGRVIDRLLPFLKLLLNQKGSAKSADPFLTIPGKDVSLIKLKGDGITHVPRVSYYPI